MPVGCQFCRSYVTINVVSENDASPEDKTTTFRKNREIYIVKLDDFKFVDIEDTAGGRHISNLTSLIISSCPQLVLPEQYGGNPELIWTAGNWFLSKSAGILAQLLQFNFAVKDDGRILFTEQTDL